MITTMVLVVGAAVLAGVGLLCLDRLTRDPVLGAAALVVLSVSTTILDDAWSPPVVAGFTILPTDVLFSAMLGAALLRMTRAKDLPPTQRILLCFLSLVLLSTARGAMVNGVQASVNDARNYLQFLGGALYFSTFVPTRALRTRFAHWWYVMAWSYVGVAVLRWAALLAGLPPVGPLGRHQEAGGVRVIDSRETLVLVIALVVILPRLVRGLATVWERRLAIVAVPVVVVLQHRTIWLVLLVALGAYVVLDPELGRRIVAVAGATVMVLGIGVVALLQAQPDATAVDTSLVEDNTFSEHTLLWRIEGWRGLLAERNPSTVDVAIGQPMGGGFEREVMGNLVDTSPHNFWIQTYLQAGAVGFVLLTTVFLVTLSRLHRLPRDDDPFSASTMRVILLVQMAFMCLWKLDQEQGLALGLALAMSWLVTGPLGQSSSAEPSRASEVL